MGKKRKQNNAQANENVNPEEVIVPLTRDSDEPVQKKGKWTNKQRVLVFGSRGLSYRDRHLMENLRTLMPHHKPEVKKEKEDLKIIDELAVMKNCNKIVYFEARKKQDLYLWISEASRGPSVKFLVRNIHTMGELKMSGNCLKGSRPLLSFDESFNTPHYAIMKELLTHTFGIPYHHPRSQPFHDKVYTFTVVDNKIWFRNYEVLSTDGKLSEIGPRFVLDPIKVFDSSFGGATLWKNPHYKTPNSIRSMVKKAKATRFIERQSKSKFDKLKPAATQRGDPTLDVFQTPAPSS